MPLPYVDGASIGSLLKNATIQLQAADPGPGGSKSDRLAYVQACVATASAVTAVHAAQSLGLIVTALENLDSKFGQR